MNTDLIICTKEQYNTYARVIKHWIQEKDGPLFAMDIAAITKAPQANVGLRKKWEQKVIPVATSWIRSPPNASSLAKDSCKQ